VNRLVIDRHAAFTYERAIQKDIPWMPSQSKQTGELQCLPSRAIPKTDMTSAAGQATTIYLTRAFQLHRSRSARPNTTKSKQVLSSPKCFVLQSLSELYEEAFPIHEKPRIQEEQSYPNFKEERLLAMRLAETYLNLRDKSRQLSPPSGISLNGNPDTYQIT